MDTETLTRSAACPVCTSRDTLVFADVRGVPVHTTILWESPEDARAAPVGDIELNFCRSCGHVFNARFEEERTGYTQAYDNSLHFSPLFQRYAEQLADGLIARHGLRGKNILEVGAGKGDFLALMVKRGNNRGVGFDPTYVPEGAHEELIRSGRMVIKQELYDPSSRRQTADMLVCRQVLEHIEKPRAFVDAIRAGAPEGGEMAVFFEVPNAMCTLRDMDIWVLIYEHCGFFTPQSLARLFSASGYDVLSVDELYEGIFLGVEARVRGRAHTRLSWSQNIEGLNSLVERFRERFQEKLSYWQHSLRTLGREGKRVVVWGGGARGVTFVNLADTDRVVRYVVDINPRKEGAFVAGTGQQLVHPSLLQTYKPDVVLLMNSIYQEEVSGMLGSLGLQPKLMVV